MALWCIASNSRNAEPHRPKKYTEMTLGTLTATEIEFLRWVIIMDLLSNVSQTPHFVTDPPD